MLSLLFLAVCKFSSVNQNKVQFGNDLMYAVGLLSEIIALR